MRGRVTTIFALPAQIQPDNQLRHLVAFLPLGSASIFSERNPLACSLHAGIRRTHAHVGQQQRHQHKHNRTSQPSTHHHRQDGCRAIRTASERREKFCWLAHKMRCLRRKVHFARVRVRVRALAELRTVVGELLLLLLLLCTSSIRIGALSMRLYIDIGAITQPYPFVKRSKTRSKQIGNGIKRSHRCGGKYTVRNTHEIRPHGENPKHGEMRRRRLHTHTNTPHPTTSKMCQTHTHTSQRALAVCTCVYIIHTCETPPSPRRNPPAPQIVYYTEHSGGATLRFECISVHDTHASARRTRAHNRSHRTERGNRPRLCVCVCVRVYRRRSFLLFI